MTRRTFLRATGALAAGAALAACGARPTGSGAHGSDVVQLVYQDWRTEWFPGMAQQMLEQFHAAHPTINVFFAQDPENVQDQMLSDAEETLRRHGGARTLARLRREARAVNLETSRGRIKSDWIEPETLFWAAWHALPAGEKAALAREAIGGFVRRVEEAASVDPRRGGPGGAEDPMEGHRHRIHPLLWQALEAAHGRTKSADPVARELKAWQAGRESYLARRPPWSQIEGSVPPWEATGHGT